MKKLMGILLTIAMLCSFAVVPASAETTLQTEVGEDGKTYYLIGNADDYAAFVTAANADLTINGKLTADIDLSGWTGVSIGILNSDGRSACSSYKGVFDGQYHIINNLSISRSFNKVADAGIAMFNSIDEATIKNLGIENATIQNTSGKDSVRMGALAGFCYNSTIENCYVKNSTIQATKPNYNIHSAGSIAAFINASTVVKNCYATGNKIGFSTSGGTASGGSSVSTFVGYASATIAADNVINCYSNGNKLMNIPSGQKKAGFIRVGTSGNTDLAFTNSYTDTLTGFDAGSTMTKYAASAAEWSTLADTLGSAFKNDTYGLNNGLPRLVWEADPGLNKITVEENIANGSVTAPAEAAEGTEVALTVTPESELYKVTAVTVNGEAIKSPYTFTMPAADVTVSATFEKRWTNGSGTEADPIIISTIADLDALRTAVNAEKHFAGIYFKLANDLDFTDVEFGTIGQIGSVAQSEVRYFAGNFDGNNKVIRNLTVNTSQRYVALFGIIKNAEIKNLGIEKSNFRQQGGYFAAGLAVQATKSVISGCYVKDTTVNVKSDGDNADAAGGLIANASGTTITNCYTKNISLKTETSDAYFNAAAGGLVGALRDASQITNCYSADISYTKAGSNIANIARVYSNSVISNTYTDVKRHNDVDSVTVYDKASDEWLTLADKLGTEVFKNDIYGSNDGMPMFIWEEEPTVVYSINIADNIANGTVKANYEKAVEGAAVRLTVTADENAAIESVTVNGEAIEAPYTFTMPANDVTVNATFVKQNTYAVNVDEAIAGGSVTVDAEAAMEGNTITVTATPESDLYKLVSVTVNGEAIASPYTFTMPANDVTVSAAFEKRWANGSGSEADPIVISTIAELDALRTAVNAEKHFAGIYFELANDLDFTDVEFGTIGQIGSVAQSEARYFAGNFDGNNKVIRNLTVNTSQRYVALFGIIKNAEIKNLGIEGAFFRQQGNYYAAGLAVLATDSVISNCYVKDSTIRIKSESGGEGANSQSMGGLIAEAKGNTSVSDCYAKNVTIALDYNAMGLNSAAGGLVGYLASTARINNCYTAEIKFNMSTAGNVAYMAREYGENTITNSYVTAKAARDTDSVTLVSEKELRAASLLGDAFVADCDMVNGGYPMLSWEASEAPAAKFIFAGYVTDEEGAVTGVKLEKFDTASVTGKLYAAVVIGEELQKVAVADINTTTKGVNVITLSESITLGENEELRIFVWDNNVSPLMYAEK